jgi:hypothetical protein
VKYNFVFCLGSGVCVVLARVRRDEEEPCKDGRRRS